MTATALELHALFCEALHISPTEPPTMGEGGSLDSIFAVSDLAQASIGAAGSAMAALQSEGGRAPSVFVDRDLANGWFMYSIRPQGWELPSPWDAVSGDYVCEDGWIRLHANAPRHRQAILAVLDVSGDRDEVAAAVRTWAGEDLESAVVGAHGAAAAMRSLDEWRRHPQGRAVAGEAVIAMTRTTTATPDERAAAGSERPLEGVRVLDLTRVLAGPVATRLLAGWGADVLRVDPPEWDEPAVVPEVTLGKRCARLDLRSERGRDVVLELLATADVLVHGYRPGALERLGLGDDDLAQVRPGLVDVSLDAYGWTGPWRGRRGFDSLVQMSSGIADAQRVATGAAAPVPLPVQALDHATGYLLAASVLAGLGLRRRESVGSQWRLSLARTAQVLVETGRDDRPGDATGRSLVIPEAPDAIEHTTWGEARRLAPPLQVEGAALRWALAARPLGTDEPAWLGR